jgi:hypothetical protein
MMKTDSDKPETVAEAKSEATLAAPSCSACVQVLRHGDSEPQWASKLVCWLAGLTSQNRVYLEPRVGDIVVETTHWIGMARHGLGLIDAVGELLKIEETKEDGKIYTIRTLEGKEQRWSNAMMAVVDRPND